MPESIPELFAAKEAITRNAVDRTLLGRAATLADVGNATAVAASDWAAAMTATSIDIPCGSEVGRARSPATGGNICSRTMRRVYDIDTVLRAFRLADEGLTQQAVADTLGVGQSTVGRWLRAGLPAVTSSPQRARATSGCPESCAVVAHAPADRYAYLLGQYLGDGTIVHTRNGVARLFITCCAAYPDIRDECSAALRTVLPHNRVWHRPRKGAVDVTCYSAHLPCLFPQHGPGRKHKRHIALVPWQEEIALVLHPDRFLRGLIHSDGCRTINHVRNSTGREYAYVRYQFTNRSDDIRRLFTDACDRLGIEWRPMKRYDISIARQTSVARLDHIVGPKT